MRFIQGKIYYTPDGFVRFCNCMELVHNLFNLTKDILSIKNEKKQWEMLKQAKSGLVIKNRPMIATGFHATNCETQNCILLLSRAEQYYKNHCISLTDLVVDLMTVLYFENCGDVCIDSIHLREKRLFQRNDREVLQALGGLKGKRDFMKLLVNSGYLSSVPKKSPLLKQEVDKIMLSFIRRINNSGNAHLLEKIIHLLKCSSFCPEEEFYKRIFLVGCALEAVRQNLQSRHDRAENFISCLKWYFLATSDPYLTMLEVRAVLYACFTLLNEIHLYDKYSEEFVKLMPECPAKAEPRRLDHLARCQIRKNLKASNLNLPAAITKLGLPRSINSFIVGDELNISRNNGSVSSQNAVTKEELAALFSERPMI